MATHHGYMVRGRMNVQLPGGQPIELAAGDVFAIPPGHDAWTVGEDACTFVEVLGTPDATTGGPL
jgi:quercetin dioxygenase-like cupin family protein